jgi:hypothetical protein
VQDHQFEHRVGGHLATENTDSRKALLTCRMQASHQISDCKAICYRKSRRTAWIRVQIAGEIREDLEQDSAGVGDDHSRVRGPAVA